MNMDYYGYFQFGDADGVRQFVMAHYFAHEAEADACAAQFGRSPGTFNVSGLNVQDEWIAAMGEDGQMTPELYDWLESHNDNHQSMLSIMSVTLPTTTGIADLSLADLTDPESLYDWLTLHQTIHQLEQKALQLS